MNINYILTGSLIAYVFLFGLSHILYSNKKIRIIMLFPSLCLAITLGLDNTIEFYEQLLRIGRLFLTFYGGYLLLLYAYLTSFEIRNDLLDKLNKFKDKTDT